MKSWTCIVIVLLLAGIIAIPGVSAKNQTMDTSYYLTHAETLAGQKDMSMYNKPVPFEPVPIRNKTTARIYPAMTRCGSDCMAPGPFSFSFNRCRSLLTIMVVCNVNATNPDHTCPVVGYGLSGCPLQDTVYVSGTGNPGLFLPLNNLAGMLS